MAKPIVAINHPEENISRFYGDDDLERLQQVADIRIIGDRNTPADDKLADVTVLMGAWGMRKLDAELLAGAPKLQAVCYSAGSIRGFITDEAWERGLIITSAWRANAIPVAEVTHALVTLAAKNWFGAMEGMRVGHSDPRVKAAHTGNWASIVGLVGFGAIGRLVADRLRSLECTVLVYDPYVDEALLSELGATRVESLEELAARCEILSIHAPNIPATQGMISAEVIAAMPDGATLINTARPSLIDQEALQRELEAGRIKAMLDVTTPEPLPDDHVLRKLPNCWVTPHRAGSTGREVQRMGRYAIDDCLRILSGEEPLHRVLPEMMATMA